MNTPLSLHVVPQNPPIIDTHVPVLLQQPYRQSNGEVVSILRPALMSADKIEFSKSKCVYPATREFFPAAMEEAQGLATEKWAEKVINSMPEGKTK